MQRRNRRNSQSNQTRREDSLRVWFIKRVLAFFLERKNKGELKFFGTGVRAHPNQRWRIGKTDGKTVSPGVFPGFFDSTSSLGVLGACSPQAVPRASELAATFSVPFWSLKKEHIPAARARWKNRLIPLTSVSWQSAPSDRRIPGRWAPPHPGSAATPCR